MYKGHLQPPVRYVLEQTPAPSTQTHPILGLECFSFGQISPKPRTGPSAGASAAALSYLLYIPPKRSWLLAGSTGLASRLQFPCSHFSRCVWLLAGEFSFQESPLKVLSESLHIHKILMASSQGLWGFTSIQESSIHTRCLS